MRDLTDDDRSAIASIREVSRSLETVLTMRLKPGPRRDEVLDYLQILVETAKSEISRQGAAPSGLPVPPPGACL